MHCLGQEHIAWGRSGAGVHCLGQEWEQEYTACGRSALPGAGVHCLGQEWGRSTSPGAGVHCLGQEYIA